MKESFFPFQQRSSSSLILASLCKCHSKFFMHVDAACSAAPHRLFAVVQMPPLLLIFTLLEMVYIYITIFTPSDLYDSTKTK